VSLKLRERETAGSPFHQIDALLLSASVAAADPSRVAGQRREAHLVDSPATTDHAAVLAHEHRGCAGVGRDADSRPIRAVSKACPSPDQRSGQLRRALRAAPLTDMRPAEQHHRDHGRRYEKPRYPAKTCSLPQRPLPRDDGNTRYRPVQRSRSYGGPQPGRTSASSPRLFVLIRAVFG